MMIPGEKAPHPSTLPARGARGAPARAANPSPRLRGEGVERSEAGEGLPAAGHG
jgi:hypothetical protein